MEVQVIGKDWREGGRGLVQSISVLMLRKMEGLKVRDG